MEQFIELEYKSIGDIIKYIGENPEYCNDIMNVFEENSHLLNIKNNNKRLLGGTYFGFYSNNILEGIFLFTNKNSLVFHYRNKSVLKKVGVLLEIKRRKPRYIKGESSQVEDLFSIIHKTVDVENLNNCLFMTRKKINVSDRVSSFKVYPISRINEIKNIDFFVEVENHFNRNYYSINDLRKKLVESKDEDYLVYENEVGIVAQGLIEKKNSRFAQIGGLYVQREYRRNGIARSILEGLINCISKTDLDPCLIVRKDNKNAVMLYEEYGFERVYDYSIYEINY